MAKLIYRSSIFEEGFIEADLVTDFLIDSVNEVRLENLKDFPNFLKEKVTVVINGDVWDVDDWVGCMLEDDDVVEILPAIAGGSSGGFWQAAIGMVLVVAGIFIMPYNVGIGFTVSMMGASMVLGAAASLLYQPPGIGAIKPPSLGYTRNDTTSDSPTYSWEGVSTQAIPGIPIPVVYGEHCVGGNIISQEIWHDGTYSWYKVILALCEGEIEGIMRADGAGVCTSRNDKVAAGTPDIKINSIPYSQLAHKNIEWDYRLGTNTQTAIPGFRSPTSSYNVGDEIPENCSVVTYDTITNTVEHIDLIINAPNGLYRIMDSGVTVGEIVGFRLTVTPLDPAGSTIVLSTYSQPLYDNPGWPSPYVSYQLSDGGTAYTSGESIYTAPTAYSTGYDDRLDAAWVMCEFIIDVWAWRYPMDQEGGGGGTYPNQEAEIKLFDDVTGDHIKTFTVHDMSDWVTCRAIWSTKQSTFKPRVFVKAPHCEVTLGWVYAMVWNCAIGGDDVQGAVQKKVSITNLPPAQYRIQISRTHYGSDSLQISDDVFLQGVNTKHFASFDIRYPNTALLYIKIRASELISGRTPNFSTKIRGKKVTVPLLVASPGGTDVNYNDAYWDSDTSSYKVLTTGVACIASSNAYGQQWTQNPVYCTKDLMINKRYGIGDYIASNLIATTNLHSTARYAWTVATTHCTASEHKHHLDIVLDGGDDAITTLTMLSRTYRGWLIWSEGTIKVLADKDEDPVQMFNMGNIEKDSFVESFVPYSQIPNIIECQYNASANDNGYDSRRVISKVDLAAGKPKREQTVDFRGIVRESHVLREGTFYLNCAKYRTRGIAFKAGLDTCHAEAGDVVKFQHDVNKWGYGGRIKEVLSASAIVVDASVAATTNGVLMIRLGNASIEEYAADVVTASRIIRTSATAFTTTPEVDQLWSYGKRDVDIQEYRIAVLQRDSDDTISIGAIQHNASIYDDSHVLVSSPFNIRPIINIASPPGPVASLSLYELDTAQPGFVAAFRPPTDANYSHAEVWIGDVPGNNLSHWANDYGIGDTTITGVHCGYSYVVGVWSVNTAGIRNDASPVYKSIYLKGQAPEPPSGLQLYGVAGNTTTFAGRDARFIWTPRSRISGVGKSGIGKEARGLGEWISEEQYGYRVEMWNGTNHRRTDTIYENDYTYTYEMNTKDGGGTPATSFTIKVWGWYDQANQTSIDNAELTVVNKLPDNITNLTATAIEDGVRFNWDKNNEDDFAKYRYRTQVENGSWSSWIESSQNEVTTYLTNSQVASQAGGQWNIALQVKAKDLYNDISATYIAASLDCRNEKPFVTVSPTPGVGHFTDIQTAVNALHPTGGGRIILKEGVYTIDTPVKFQAPGKVGYYIEGVAKDSVIVRSGLAGSSCFVIKGQTGDFTFKSFTLGSFLKETTTGYGITCDASPAADSTSNPCNITLDNLNIIKNSKFSYNTSIRLNHNSGKILLKNLVFDSAGGVRSTYNNVFTVRNCLWKKTGYTAMPINHSVGKGKVEIDSNTILNVEDARFPVIRVVTTEPGARITNNVIRSATYTLSIGSTHYPLKNTNWTGIEVSGAPDAVIVGNYIVASYVATGMQFIGIKYDDLTVGRGTITNNDMRMNAASCNGGLLGRANIGIYLARSQTSHCKITNNNIYFDLVLDGPDGESMGILTPSGYNLIANNYIDLVNNTSSDVGIDLSAFAADYCYGQGNIIGNCGVGIDDSGDNEVTATYF